jgi:tetratricopeptide (TPR) repeat protein
MDKEMSDSSKSRIEMLKQYITDDANDTFSHYALALEYAKIGNYAEAISILGQILERESNYLPAYYQLAKLYEESRRPEMAKNIYVKGILVARQQKDVKTENELRSALEGLDE